MENCEHWRQSHRNGGYEYHAGKLKNIDEIKEVFASWSQEMYPSKMVDRKALIEKKERLSKQYYV